MKTETDNTPSFSHSRARYSNTNSHMLQNRKSKQKTYPDLSTNGKRFSVFNKMHSLLLITPRIIDLSYSKLN